MGPQLSDIPAGKTIFIDANIFLYEIFNHPVFGENSHRVLKDVENGHQLGLTSTLVLDEVLYKMMLMEASNKFHISSKDSSSYLKRNPQKITALTASWKYIQKIQRIDNLKIEGISPEIFEMSIEIAKTNMLLTHDASHLAVMRFKGLSDIATNDSDFERIEGVKVWRP